jgi:hypothetical protein
LTVATVAGAAFALSVLRRCVDFPRTGNQESAAWALRARSKVEELEQMHARGWAPGP